MAALTEADYQDLIIAEVGDNGAGLLTTNIDLLWSRFGAFADLDLRYLYTKRAAIDLMLGDARRQVNFRTSSGSAVDLSDLFKHLAAMRGAVDAEIAVAETAASGAGGAIGELKATAPIMRDRIGQSDPNRRALRGDPLKRW